jgi:hypothetical protein
MRTLVTRVRDSRTPFVPPLREVLDGLRCWVRGCAVEGQFCTRCGRFWP